MLVHNDDAVWVDPLEDASVQLMGDVHPAPECLLALSDLGHVELQLSVNPLNEDMPSQTYETKSDL